MELNATAKINLGLSVVEKRSDGFHNIESCFVPVGWSDQIELTKSDQLSFESSGIPIPGKATDNLCLNAYRLLQQDFDLSPVRIKLNKQIPIGAGLGGGSADAAFVLKGLNELFQLNVGVAQLEDYARKLGSDCAFFVRNQLAYCFGKGDQFDASFKLQLPDLHLLLVYPNIHVSTADAYAGIQAQPSKMDIREVLRLDVHQWRGHLVNDFEKTVFSKYPDLKKIKARLYESGATYAAMSGSGSTIFGLFEKEPQIEWPKEYHVWKGKLGTI